MATPPPHEAALIDRHVVLALSPLEAAHGLGPVRTLEDRPDLAHKTVYLAGDLSRLQGDELAGAARVYAIEDLAHGLDRHGFERVSLGRVPLQIAGAGVYFRRFFAENYFHRVCAEHAFQALTESSKPSRAHRTGLYITQVSQQGEALHFRLLRCSTNLAGPTAGFRAADHDIVDALNREARALFGDHAPLNHVLAQLYANTPASDGQRQTKAKISAHADKTKDMPVDGIMAFCTFYDGLDKLAPLATDPFDRGHRGKSGLTRLCFRPKESASGAVLPEFTLTLYPGSVFFMPLSTNRRYTHEIQSSMLNAELLPTRLGYVVRCSKTEAMHKDGTTFLKRGDQLVPMEAPTEQGVAELRALYAAENRTDAVIDYGDKFLFSMNAGDYQAPDPARD